MRVMVSATIETVVAGFLLIMPLGLEFGEASEATVQADRRLSVQMVADKLVITCAEQPVAEYVFRDPKILRPYFANVYSPSGIKVTRNHPPRDGDATDHDTMHPGIWLAFGDMSGQDYWRNKARVEHRRFVEEPKTHDGAITFATESDLLKSSGERLCRSVNRFTIRPESSSWLIIWDATFHADDGDFLFGDQEEMGFGARVATRLTEKGGGTITNSKGLTTAGKTWGQPASWCDYSGSVEGKQAGITLLASPSNFRDCWWHNRDYGVFVANPFGRAAMKQGDRSTVTVTQGKTFRIAFAAAVHDDLQEPLTTSANRWLERLTDATK